MYSGFGLCETTKLKMYDFHSKYIFGTLEIEKLLSIWFVL